MPVKLFVGGLSFSTSSDRLRETFARFGVVDSATVMTDRETGRSRGFGFVEMTSPDEAEQAIGALNGSSLDGRTIRVDKATPRGAGPRAGYAERRSGGGPLGAGPRSGFVQQRPPLGGGFQPRPISTDRPGAGRSERPGFDDRPGRGFGEQRRGDSGEQRRGWTGGQGQRRGGSGSQRGSGGDQRRGSGLRKGGPGAQRRSGDRGRRSLGDEGGYRPF